MKTITIKEASKMSGMAARTLRNWIQLGYIKRIPSKAGPPAKVIIERDSLIKYLATRTSTLGGKPHKKPIDHQRYIEHIENENRRHITDIDDLKKELKETREELRNANQRIAELSEKSHSLELELSKAEGVHIFRRLLKAVW